jgi:hypothetical protein
MGLFGGDRGYGRRVDVFWSWWAAHRTELLAGIEDTDRRDDTLDRLLAPQVRALHDGFTWFFGTGDSRDYRLVLSPGGRIDLLPLTEQWYAAAADDPRVEFLPARPRRRDGAAGEEVVVGGTSYPLGTALVAVRPLRGDRRVGITMYHEAFGHLVEGMRFKLALTILDAEVGEYVRLTMLGDLVCETSPHPELLPVAELRAALGVA